MGDECVKATGGATAENFCRVCVRVCVWGKAPFCWTTKDRSAGQTDLTHTHTQLSISQDTEGWKEQKKETDENELCVLTRTLANLSSSSPGSGMGSFRGMLCPLKSGCCSMLPAFPMFPLRATFHPHPCRSLILPLLPEKGEKGGNLHGVKNVCVGEIPL